MSDLLTTFKIEILVNQEKMSKDLHELQEFKKDNGFAVNKNKELIDSFDYKLEKYRLSLQEKMDQFDP